MSLSKRVVETLMDLVEIKLSCMEVYDREDSREVASLERCRRELQEMLSERHSAKTAKGAVVAFPQQPKGRTAAG